MTIQQLINENGFYFDYFNPDLNIYHRIMNTVNPDSYIQSFFSNYLKNKNFSFRTLHMVYEDIKFGQYHELHTHLTPSDFQAVVWVPQEKYTGRAFLYGTEKNIEKFYPKFGDICFMKTNDLKFIHGVEPLLSDTLVRTLLISINYSGTHGEHLTVSHSSLEPI